MRIGPGELSPAEFGKVTIWQLRYLYGFSSGSGSGSPRSGREAYWHRMRILGHSEFEIWRKWHDEMKAAFEVVGKPAMLPSSTEGAKS